MSPHTERELRQFAELPEACMMCCAEKSVSSKVACREARAELGKPVCASSLEELGGNSGDAIFANYPVHIATSRPPAVVCAT